MTKYNVVVVFIIMTQYYIVFYNFSNA